MYPISIHLSFWQSSWQDDLAALIRRAKLAGYDGAEIPLLEPFDLDYGHLRDVLYEEKMGVTCSTGLGRETDISHADPEIRKAGIAHLRACLEGAAQLGSKVVVGVTYAAWGLGLPGTRSERTERSIKVLQEVGKIATDLGVMLCLEVLNRFETDMLNTVAQGLAILDQVGQPAIKLHLDTFHMNIEEPDIEKAIRQAGSQIGHFHCSENHRGIPGTGHIPWGQVFSALREVEYRGWLAVESFVRSGNQVGNALNIWRDIGGNRDQMARLGVDFIREHLETSKEGHD